MEHRRTRGLATGMLLWGGLALVGCDPGDDDTAETEDHELTWTWTVGGPTRTDYEAATDDEVTWSGVGVSQRLSSVSPVTLGGASLMAEVPVGDFAGQRVRFSVRIRSEDVAGYGAAQFQARILQGMQARATTGPTEPIVGSRDWAPYVLDLDIAPDVTTLVVGGYLRNAGTIWLDDARLEVVAADGPDDDRAATAPQDLDLEGPIDALGFPPGWGDAGAAPFLYTVARESTAVHSGQSALSMTSDTAIASDFVSVSQAIHADAYRGQRVRLTAWIETEDVVGNAAAWMRVDGRATALAFDNMADRPITGTTDWTEYSVVLDVADVAVAITFGVLQVDQGTTRFDHLGFEVVDGSVPTTGL